MDGLLLVNRDELIEAFKRLFKSVKLKDHAEAVLSMQEGLLRIDLGGITVKAAADGVWDGRARVAPRFLLDLSKASPPGSPVQVSVQGGQLYVGQWSAPCVWTSGSTAPPQPKPILLPVNPPLSRVLALSFLYTEEEIAASGLAGTVAAAQKKRDQLIAQAAALLLSLSVKPDDLQRTVDDCIRSEYCPDGGNKIPG